MKVIVSVGGRFHAFNLAQQLLKRGFLARLITSYPSWEVKKYGIPLRFVKSILFKEIVERGWVHLPFSVRQLWNPRLFASEFFDHHAASCLMDADLFVGWASKSLQSIRRAKDMGMVTVVERGSSHIGYQEDILREEYEKFGIHYAASHPRLLERELKEYKEADYISTPSSFTRRTFLDRGFPLEKIIQVPYGVDLSSFYQVPKEDDVFRVVFAGGMTLRKGVHYLLRAFSELKLPNSELLLVGAMNDEIRPFFRKYRGAYKYIGHVPQRELYGYYSQGSVFAMCSLEEGLAMVQFQAMACGLPVICTTNTGGEDIVRNGKDGFVVPIRDTETLKEKLTYFYENPEDCARMGQSAKERVSAGFTWDDYGENICSEYARILDTKVAG